VDYEVGVKVEVAISARITRVATGATVWSNAVSEVGTLSQRDVPGVVSQMNRTTELAIYKLLSTILAPLASNKHISIVVPSKNEHEILKKEIPGMKSSKIFAGVTVALLNLALCTVAVGQDKATAQEVVTKVREAASTLSKTGDVAQFNQKQGPWVWKNTYVFVVDCDKKILAAHPMNPELVGKDLISIEDTKGKSICPDPEHFCKKVQETRRGIWSDYWWPKPGEEQGSHKLSYHLSAKGTPYVVSSG